ncbi:MAG TPA: DHA2 family efflux MFS transporter permease subunit [Negativicutes bacterium]
MIIPRLDIRDEIYKWLALATILIGAFASVLNMTSTNIALPKMMAAFSVGATDAQWIITAYTLTLGVLQPVSGYLCDRFGARRIYLFSLILFNIGSGLCGTAWSNESMITFRVIQAMGGGFVIPSSMYIVFSEFAPQERNMALGIWGLSLSLAPAAGPTLGGYLADYWNWSYIYFINVPIGILGLIVATIVLRETKTTKSSPFDFPGFLCSSIGIFCLLLALSKGVDDGWDAPYIIALFYTAFATLTLFVIREMTVADPLLDLSLFRDRNFVFGNLVSIMVQFLLMGSMYLIPLFLQRMMGYSAMDSGIFLLPSAAASLVMSPLAGKLAGKFGEKPMLIAGFLLSIWWTSQLVSIDADTDVMLIVWMQTLRGASIGLASMTATVLSMKNIAGHKIGRANAIINTLRQIAGSFAVTVMATVMQQRQLFHQEHIAEHVNYASIAFHKLLAQKTQQFMHSSTGVELSHRKAIAFLYNVAQKQSAYFSYDDAFFVLEIFAIIGFIAALLIKSRKVTKNALL